MVDFRLLNNRGSGRAMPTSSADRQVALTIMEWVHADPEAEQAAPDAVRAYREFCKQPFADEAYWRTAFDYALDVWKIAYDVHLVRQAF